MRDLDPGLVLLAISWFVIVAALGWSLRRQLVADVIDVQRSERSRRVLRATSWTFCSVLAIGFGTLLIEYQGSLIEYQGSLHETDRCGFRETSMLGTLLVLVSLPTSIVYAILMLREWRRHYGPPVP